MYLIVCPTSFFGRVPRKNPSGGSGQAFRFKSSKNTAAAPFFSGLSTAILHAKPLQNYNL